jgi:branched-chain amino acid transport system permease protein
MMQVIADGLVAASFITLGVVGLSMIYNILNFPTFAQGDHIAVGAYFALGVVALAGTAGSVAGLSFGWPLILGLFCAAVLTAVVALALDRAIFAQLRRRDASRISLIMASFGVALMLRYMIVMAAGHDPHYYAFAITPALNLGGVRIQPNELISIGVTVAMVVGLHLFLTRTWLGRSMRAVSENPTLARVNGIDVGRVVRWTWIIGAGMAAVAGVLPMFAALIVGGMTNIYGAVLGAVLIGLAEALTIRYLAPEYRQAVSFIAVFVVLMVRPQGILGEKP